MLTHASERTTTAPPSTGQASTAARRRRRRESGTAFLFLSPWLVGMVALTAGPMLYSLYLAFTRYNLLTSPQWVGGENFRRMLHDDPRFIHSVVVTALYVAISVPLLLVVAMLVAVLLNSRLGFRTGYRALFYLPSLMGASVAVAALWRVVFGSDGLVNAVLGRLGIHHTSWVGDPRTALGTIVLLALVGFGSTMVIFLAGLRQVPRELLEAAEVDGAGPVRRFFSITLPILTPLVFFNSLMVTIHAFQAFTAAYVVSSGTGGPADSTLFYTLYLYQQGFAQLNMGYAAAMAWVLVVVLAVVTGLFFWSARFWVHYGDEA